ncbi:MAG UNVERIFIED_CONTAM: hypothetical protein LVR18_24840 [Planctomycetaceae bacterium]
MRRFWTSLWHGSSIENWVGQARELCAQRKAVVESYPSTFFRMLTVVVCRS